MVDAVVVTTDPTSSSPPSVPLRAGGMRPPSFARRLLRRAVFARQRWARAEDAWVTCPGIGDGGGAQAHARLATMVYARGVGLRYAHTPLRNVSHRPPGADDWDARWESFLGLGLDETPAAEIERRASAVVRVDDVTQIRPRPGTLHVVPHGHTYANLHPAGYEPLREVFRERYARSPKPAGPAWYTPGAVNVAIHVRRGDVARNRETRLTGNAFVAAAIRDLTGAIREAGARPVVRLFSEGAPEDFGEAASLGVEFRLDEDVFRTFDSLARADVLVMARSCFSYLAALINRGVALHEPAGHRGLPDWLALGRDGRADRRALRRRLDALAARREGAA